MSHFIVIFIWGRYSPSSFVRRHSLSDESSVIPGSLGLLPSSSLAGAPDPKATVMGLYEP